MIQYYIGPSYIWLKHVGLTVTEEIQKENLTQLWLKYDKHIQFFK